MAALLNSLLLVSPSRAPSGRDGQRCPSVALVPGSAWNAGHQRLRLDCISPAGRACKILDSRQSHGTRGRATVPLVPGSAWNAGTRGSASSASIQQAEPARCWIPGRAMEPGKAGRYTVVALVPGSAWNAGRQRLRFVCISPAGRACKMLDSRQSRGTRDPGRAMEPGNR